MLVITDLEVGGAEKCLTQLALRANRQQFNPEVVVLQPPPPPERAAYTRELEAAGVPVHFLNARTFWSLPRVVWQLWWRLRKQPKPVVQCFLYHANVAGVLAARLAGIRGVYVGVRVAEQSRFRRRVEKFVYSLAQAIVYVSRSVRRGYRNERWGFPFVITNGIEIEPYQSALPAKLADEGIPDEVPLLLFIGRLHEQKGLDWLFPLLPQIFTALPEHHFAIVGTGPQREWLQAEARKLQIEDRVHFLAWRTEVPSLLQRAQLLLLPSRYEGMPNVVLEAMAAGLPAIVTRCEGVAELLGEETNHLAVDFGEDAAMIDRIVILAGDEERRQQISTILLERAREHFSMEVKTLLYESLWEEAILQAGAAYPKFPLPPPDKPAPEEGSI